ncbi:MAG: branched-chain amino acid transport system ATP-binding protein [Thermodesulfobacteriota bacterium]|nr:branched-chain amino acid transport system ATP-binding protein [Thermodesulfobacteriota bacterium]
MLEVAGLNTYYGYSHILHGVSLKVPRGQVVALLGRNGVGKTTLVHTIVSFAKPTTGKILLNGQDITGHPTHEIVRRGIALVPQGRRVFRSLTVTENLTIPLRCSLGEESTIEPWKIETVFETFPTLRARREQRAGNLSGGEQQMLAMGRALVRGPQVLLLDEPSEGLAPMIVEEISKVIGQLAMIGMSVLLVEQNFRMALNLANNIFVMSRGQIVHESSPESLDNNEEIKSRYLGM